jgi:hypothetical protein
MKMAQVGKNGSAVMGNQLESGTDRIWQKP